jgi:hypothetical protein
VQDGASSDATFTSGVLSLQIPQSPALFSLPPLNGITPLICATPSTINLVLVTVTSSRAAPATVVLQHITTSPILSHVPTLLLPVDPMVWNPSAGSLDPATIHGGAIPQRERDAFVTISPDGELSFWVLYGFSGLPNNQKTLGWRCTQTVHTGRKHIAMAQCSSAKKTALGLYSSYLCGPCVLILLKLWSTMNIRN